MQYVLHFALKKNYYLHLEMKKQTPYIHMKGEEVTQPIWDMWD